MAKGTINKVIIIGNVGADPELKYTASNTAVVQFNVATTEAWKDQDGNQQEKTEWHRIVAWRKLAEIIGEYVKKGSKIYVEGKLQTRKWQDKDGNDRYTTEIISDSIQFLGGGNGTGAAGSKDTPPTAPDNSEDEESLPF